MSRIGRFLLEHCTNDFRINLSHYVAELDLLKCKPLELQMHAIKLGIVTRWA